MILTNPENLPRYDALIPSLAEVARFIGGGEKPGGRYELANGAYAMVKEGVTRAEVQPRFEAHRRYVDVHYLLAGSERIVWRNTGGLRVQQEYNPEKDNIFYSGMGGCAVDLQPGDMLICFEEDGHKANNSVFEPQPYKKIVFKLPVMEE